MGKRIVIGVLLVAVMCLAVAAQVTAQPTPFVIAGYVSYVNGTACNDPNVEITNTNTSESWGAENASASNYYQLVLTSEDVSAGAHLQINVSGCGQSKTEEHTVTQDEMDCGGFMLNISTETSPSNIFDTGHGTYPSIMGVHTGNFTPNCNITVHQIYTYPCPGTGGHSERVIFYDGEDEKINVSWGGYQGDYHNITVPSVELVQKHVYNYTIITGSYPQIIHNQTCANGFGTMTCTRFEDANGREYEDWIPAIKLG